MLNFLFNIVLFFGAIVCFVQSFHCAKTTRKFFKRLINKNVSNKRKMTHASFMFLFGLATLLILDLGVFLLLSIS